MRFSAAFFIMWPLLMLYGCFDHNLSGDAYIVKGGGDIVPVAGKMVYLLPYENEINFLYDVAASAYEIDKNNLPNRLESMYKSGLRFSVDKKNELNKKLEEIKINYIPHGKCDSIQITCLKLLEDGYFDEFKDCWTKLNQCANAEDLIISIERSISELENMNKMIISFKNNDNLEDAISTIEQLNKNYDAEITIPGTDESYIKESFSFLAKKLEESLQTKTTINGSYEFKKVKTGNFLLFTEYSDNFNSGFWLKPIRITENVKVDLTNDEMVYAPFHNYISIQLSEACKGCGIDNFKKSIKSRDYVVEAYKLKAEVLLQINESLRKIIDDN